MTGILHFGGRSRLQLIRQSEAAECGIACLAMVSGVHGLHIDLATMRRRFNVSMKGMTLRTLIDVGAAIGLSSRPVRCEVDELHRLTTPALLHWSGNHFVVLERCSRGRLIIFDPASGVERMDLAKASRHFTGVAVEVTPSPNFRPGRDRNPLRLSTLLRVPREVARGLTQTVILSLVIEALMLASPFYMQMVIDDGVVKGDRGFLSVLALAFGMVLLFRVVATTVRGFTLQFISQSLSFDMQMRVFHHMLRLPLEWFHKRQIGDIQSRFSAIQPIQAFIANGALAGVLDGVLGTAVLVLMVFYSPMLAGIVLASVLLYLVVRTATMQFQRRLAGDVLVTQALQQTRFLEAVRAIGTIKSAAAETVKEGQQRNATAAALNASIRSGNLLLSSSAATATLDGLTDILIVYLGARAIIGGQMTVGMLTAFMAYKMQFGSRLTNLIEQFITWRLLSVNLERLSDIALSATEPRINSGGYEGSLVGAIECRNVGFTYAYGEPAVLAGIGLFVAPGDYIAITGVSGCGKSTLIKLLVGLYRPTEGSVLIDGRPISHWNVKALRRQIAIVSQDDTLMAGSIAENIALFDEAIDMELVRRCAAAAQIHQDIVAMPMGYETLVGDMGSSLSGGQKQRVMIARALYARPSILVLDEGTSHLDVANERAINDALGSLKITRIVVAHRPETIRAANKRFTMSGGRLFAEQLEPEAAAEENR